MLMSSLSLSWLRFCSYALPFSFLPHPFSIFLSPSSFVSCILTLFLPHVSSLSLSLSCILSPASSLSHFLSPASSLSCFSFPASPLPLPPSLSTVSSPCLSYILPPTSLSMLLPLFLSPPSLSPCSYFLPERSPSLQALPSSGSSLHSLSPPCPPCLPPFPLPLGSFILHAFSPSPTSFLPTALSLSCGAPHLSYFLSSCFLPLYSFCHHFPLTPGLSPP